jgi:hypothetical protein
VEGLTYRATVIAALLALCATLATVPAWGQSARMAAALHPERLGAPTALSLRLMLPSSEGSLPPPLATIDIHYPANLGLITSGLGLASCSPALLEAEGPSVCPANSRMGAGSATVKFAIGPETREETVRLALLAGPSPDGYLHLLVSAIGEYPVFATILMTAVLHAGQLQITVPPVPGLPGSPAVSLVRMNVTIGGNLTYYEHAHGRTIAYKPRGISLPPGCPRGGFRFASELSFLDGTHTAAQAVVACPRRRAHH